jgi:cytosine/adenosine deaminase-related metal-dependent hydrolase
MAFPLRARLLAGVVKNVLAGVTTVAHHNPRYREIGRAYPVRILEKYGWAHSLGLEGKPVGARGELGAGVARACAETPASQPFIVHAGEGVDDRAIAEIEELDRLNCLRENTVLVHGVAITGAVWRRVLDRGSSLVWCPASNMFLFGQTLPARRFFDADAKSRSRLCIGTDSRLTGARDLLDELRVARAVSQLSPMELLHAVTEAPGRALRLPDAGRISPGRPADFVVLPALRDDVADTVLAAGRRDLLMVAVGGRPVVGAPSLRAVFSARGARARRMVIDGAERIAESSFAAAIARSPISDPGVACA